MTVVIRDTHGQKIASVLLSPPDGGQSIGVERVLEGKGTLLSYYFGRGKREVTIESETFQLAGVLKTNWAQHERKWRVALDPAAALRVAEYDDISIG